MNKNNILTKFDEGGLHENNPNGGVMIGNNASVEEGETMKDNFVYSNRIVLDANIVSQYNLPKSLIGKSVADATKMIDSKFKDRTDKISQSTKNSMLSKIAEAQEAMKPQKPEVEQSQEGMIKQSLEMMRNTSQMALGGDVNKLGDSEWYGQNNPYFTTNPGVQQPSVNLANNQLSASNVENKTNMVTDATMPGISEVLKSGQAIMGGLGSVTSSLLSKSKIDTLGTSASAKVNSNGDILKQGFVSAISDPSPSGVIKSLFSTGAGLITAGKDRKAAAENTKNFASNTNRQFTDTYAMGGLMGSIDPKKKITTSNTTVNNLLNSLPIDSNNPVFNTKKIVKYQPGVTNDKMGSGFYLYSKDPTQAGFDYKRDRKFVKQDEMMAVQRTPEWKEYMTNESLKRKQLFNGGKINPLESFLKPTMNSNLKTTNNFYTGENDLRERMLDENYINPASIKNFKSPKMYTRNTIEPTFGQELKMFGKEALNKGVNSMKNVDLGNIARYAPIAMNAYQLSQLKKPNGERLDRLTNRYNPEYVDEKSLQNIADNAMNNSVNAISQSGASQGQLRSSLIGSQLQRTKALSDAYMSASSQNRATNDRAQTFNLGVDQINLNQSNTEKDINARDQAAYRNEKSKYLSEIGNNIGDVGKEEVYKNIIAKSVGYKWDGEYVRTPEGKVVTDPNTGKPITEERLKELQSANSGKKALGGYLIKNRKK